MSAMGTGRQGQNSRLRLLFFCAANPNEAILVGFNRQIISQFDTAIFEADQQSGEHNSVKEIGTSPSENLGGGIDNGCPAITHRLLARFILYSGIVRRMPTIDIAVMNRGLQARRATS